LDFEIIDVKDSVPHDDIVWFSAPSEIINFPSIGTPIPVELDTIDSAILSAIYQLKGSLASVSLIIGVDPGPYPGIAWLVDGAFCGIIQLTTIRELMPNLVKLRQIGNFDKIIIRVGDGAPLIRDRIINDCIANNWVVEQVDEKKTSSGLIRNNHSTSALRIAAQPGVKIWQQRDIKPTQGEIKYIQTESRKQSKGEITISRTAAILVAKGEISMDEALANPQAHSSEE
tara:strand:+ start:3187 stop:3873 length:687 start_codon:yes stop_codon:yes gene_type:complete